MCVCGFWLVYVTEVKKKTFLYSLKQKQLNNEINWKAKILLTNEQMNPEKKKRKGGQKLVSSIHFCKTNQNILTEICDLHYFNGEKRSQHLKLTILFGSLS